MHVRRCVRIPCFGYAPTHLGEQGNQFITWMKLRQQTKAVKRCPRRIDVALLFPCYLKRDVEMLERLPELSAMAAQHAINEFATRSDDTSGVLALDNLASTFNATSLKQRMRDKHAVFGLHRRQMAIRISVLVDDVQISASVE